MIYFHDILIHFKHYNYVLNRMKILGVITSAVNILTFSKLFFRFQFLINTIQDTHFLNCFIYRRTAVEV